MLNIKRDHVKEYAMIVLGLLLMLLGFRTALSDSMTVPGGGGTLQEVTDAGNTTTNWIQIQDDLFASGSAYLGGGFGSTGCSVNDFNGRLQCDGNVEGYILSASFAAIAPEIQAGGGWSGGGSGSTLYSDGSSKYNSFLWTDSFVDTQGSYGGGGCRLGTHLQCDGSIWASGTYYGDGSGLTGLSSTSTLQDALDNGNTGTLTADDTMELTGTSTYRTLFLDHGAGAGNVLDIDTDGTGDALSISNSGTEHFYIEADGTINATGTIVSRPALNAIREYAMEVRNPTYFREGGSYGDGLLIGGRSVWNGAIGMLFEDASGSSVQNYGAFFMLNSSSGDARAIHAQRTNTNGATVEIRGGSPSLLLSNFGAQSGLHSLTNHSGGIAVELESTSIEGGSGSYGHLLDIKTSQAVGDIIQINYGTYSGREQNATMFDINVDWEPTIVSYSDNGSVVFDINLDSDFSATTPTDIDLRQVMNVTATGTVEAVLIEVNSDGSGGIMNLTETNTGSASDTVIISNAGTGYSTTWEDAGVAVLSVEPDGDILDRTGSYYYMRGETTTPARMEYGRDTVTSASTGSVTFANAFSATPTVTCTWEKNQVAAAGTSCWTYDMTASSFKWELASTMASGTVNWSAVGSN